MTLAGRLNVLNFSQIRNQLGRLFPHYSLDFKYLCKLTKVSISLNKEFEIWSVDCTNKNRKPFKVFTVFVFDLCHY